MVLFFNGTATAEIYTLSLRDALPNSSLNGLAMRNSAPAALARSRISAEPSEVTKPNGTPEPDERSACRHSMPVMFGMFQSDSTRSGCSRSEEHTSELQSRQYLVCRLLLEKKK